MRLPEPSSPVTGPFNSSSTRRDSVAFGRGPDSAVGFAQPLIDFTALMAPTSQPTPPLPPARDREPLSARRDDSPSQTQRSSQDEVNEAQRAEASQDSGEDDDDEAVVDETSSLSIQPAVVEIAAIEPEVAPHEVDSLPLPSADTTDSQVPTPSNQDRPHNEPVTVQPRLDASDEPEQPVSPDEATDPATPLETHAGVVQTAAVMVDQSASDKTPTVSPANGPVDGGVETHAVKAEATSAVGLKSDGSTIAAVESDVVAVTAPTTDDQTAIAAVDASLPSEETNSRSSNRRSRGRGESVSSGKQRDTQRGAADDAQRRDFTPGASGTTLRSPQQSLEPTAASLSVAPESTAPAANGIDPAMAQRIAALASPAPASVAAASAALAGTDASVGTVGDDAAATTTVGPVAGSDDSRPTTDRSSLRAEPALSKTDIADRARLVHRISKAFTKMGVDGGQIRMKMHPETLGGVLLEMRVQGRMVEATVTADNEAARGLLQQQLSELRQRLESQGMIVQKLEVALRDDSASGGTLLGDQRGGGFQRHEGGSGDDAASRRAAAMSGAAGRRSTDLPTGGSSTALGERTATRAKWPALPGTLDLHL